MLYLLCCTCICIYIPFHCIKRMMWCCWFKRFYPSVDCSPSLIVSSHHHSVSMGGNTKNLFSYRKPINICTTFHIIGFQFVSSDKFMKMVNPFQFRSLLCFFMSPSYIFFFYIQQMTLIVGLSGFTSTIQFTITFCCCCS